ncbi:MAG: hypothetical protein U1E53_03250 [Dongiaceae bacterium]
MIWPGRLEARYEWAGLEPWLRGRGLAVRLRLVESPSDGRHEVGSLERTADTEALRRTAGGLPPGSCEAALWACTSGSFVGGLAHARAQAAAIAAATGAPATSTSLALVAAARALGAGRVALLSPYPEDATARLVAFLAEAGIEVAALRRLDCPSGEDSNALDLAAAAEAFGAGLPAGGPPLLVPDTAINSLALVELLEACLGRAVITANQATLWHGLALAGRDAAGLGGRLARVTLRE